jgi:hypothetical protein
MAKTSCPKCGNSGAQVYSGDNEHKQNTVWCATDGRVALPPKPKPEPEAEVETKAEDAGMQGERPSAISRAPR